MATAPDDIFSMFNDADAKFGTIRDENGKEVELTHGRFGGFMESSDRRVRKEAFEALYQTYDQFKNTLAATYSANVKKAKFYADVRKYPSALAAALAPGNIPTEVYDNLIETVHRFLPAMYRYVALRKRALGVEELHMYDVYVPLVADQTKKIPFAEAKEIVKRGLAPMGEEYVSHLEEGFDHRWIDVYENRGKRSGAYSWGAYGTHPYVLLNYQGKLDDVFTLAHEMGHALHSWYSNANQPYVYSGYLIFVAEVASTCNESLLMQYLLKESKDKKEKAYLLNHFIDQFKGTLFRQTMFAEFEKITHEMYAKGESLTAERLCAGIYGSEPEIFRRGNGIGSADRAGVGAHSAFLYGILCVSVRNRFFLCNRPVEKDPRDGRGGRCRLYEVLKRRMLQRSDRTLKNGGSGYLHTKAGGGCPAAV